MDNRPIGIFDSGIGGLTCIPHLMRELPEEKIIYFGDTARVPYSARTFPVIRSFSMQIADFLVEQDVKMIVIACNTATVASIEAIREKYPNIPVVGIIDKAVEKVAEVCTKEQRIGIIATKTTIGSGIYEKLIKFLNSELNVYSVACQAFALLIEEGIVDKDIMNLVIKHYLDDFVLKHKIDTMVLGCTHYPIIRENIEELYPDINIIDPSVEVVNKIKEQLAKRDIFAKDSACENVFYASELTETFKSMMAKTVKGSEANIKLKVWGDMTNYDT